MHRNVADDGNVPHCILLGFLRRSEAVRCASLLLVIAASSMQRLSLETSVLPNAQHRAVRALVHGVPRTWPRTATTSSARQENRAQLHSTVGHVSSRSERLIALPASSRAVHTGAAIRGGPEKGVSLLGTPWHCASCASLVPPADHLTRRERHQPFQPL